MLVLFCYRKVVEFKHPEELWKLVDFKLENKPTNNDHLLDTCKNIIKYSVKTGKGN